MLNYIKKNYGWLIVLLISLGQLAIVIMHIDFTNGISFKPDPERPNMTGLEFMVHLTGEIAIRWMVAVLTATPIYILLGLHNVLVRQALGIATAVFSFLHLIFFIKDEGFMATFSELNFIAGFIATLILIPLFFTSNRKSMRLLKTGWKKIQQYAYLAIVLSIIHIAALDDIWIAYALVIGLGFVMRIEIVKQRIIAKRKEIRGTR
jgi:sulfoxide reductase heme-binding subunit YedZ